jgi:hypothetical protein
MTSFCVSERACFVYVVAWQVHVDDDAKPANLHNCIF